MELVINILILIIAFLHLYFLYFEMFAWTTKGKKIFHRFPAEFFEKTKGLAANQGLYNGFLSAGLIWSVLISNQEWSNYVALFFLSCVALAGIFGGKSVDKKIFLIQGIPALIAIILLLI